MNENEFLSIKEFAQLLNVHPNTIRRAIKSGRINAVKISAGTLKPIYRIFRGEINRLAFSDLEKIIEKLIEKKNSE